MRVEGHDDPLTGEYSDVAGLRAGVSQHCGVPVHGLECYDPGGGDFFPLEERDLRSRMRVRITETRLMIRRDLRDDPKVDAAVAARFIELRAKRDCNIYVVETESGHRAVCLDCAPVRLLSPDLSNVGTHLTSMKHSRADPYQGLYKLLSTAAGQNEDAWKQLCAPWWLRTLVSNDPWKTMLLLWQLIRNCIHIIVYFIYILA